MRSLASPHLQNKIGTLLDLLNRATPAEGEPLASGLNSSRLSSQIELSLSNSLQTMNLSTDFEYTIDMQSIFFLALAARAK